MKYTKIERAGNSSIEHIVEGDYEEVAAVFAELNETDDNLESDIKWAVSSTTTDFINR